MSLVGRNERFPVRMLRDTGAHDSLVLEMVLAFSKESATSCNMLVLSGTGFFRHRFCFHVKTWFSIR